MGYAFCRKNSHQAQPQRTQMGQERGLRGLFDMLIFSDMKRSKQRAKYTLIEM
jgi:hypothetical protein